MKLAFWIWFAIGMLPTVGIALLASTASSLVQTVDQLPYQGDPPPEGSHADTSTGIWFAEIYPRNWATACMVTGLALLLIGLIATLHIRLRQ